MTTDERLDQVIATMTEMRQEMAGMRQETAGMRQEIGQLTRYVMDLRSEVITRLDILDSRLTTLTGFYGSLEARLNPVAKGMLELGEIVNRVHIEQSRLARLVQPAA
jgi:hypothetical protein